MGFFSRWFGPERADGSVLGPDGRIQSLRPLDPVNDLERWLRQVCEEDRTVLEFLEPFLRSKVVVPSSSAPEDTGGGTSFEPLILTWAEGPMLAVLTDPSRTSTLEALEPKSAVIVDATWMLGRVPDGVGIVINPGWTVTLTLSAPSVEQLRRNREGR